MAVEDPKQFAVELDAPPLARLLDSLELAPFVCEAILDRKIANRGSVLQHLHAGSVALSFLLFHVRANGLFTNERRGVLTQENPVVCKEANKLLDIA